MDHIFASCDRKCSLSSNEYFQSIFGEILLMFEKTSGAKRSLQRASNHLQVIPRLIRLASRSRL